MTEPMMKKACPTRKCFAKLSSSVWLVCVKTRMIQKGEIRRFGITKVAMNLEVVYANILKASYNFILLARSPSISNLLYLILWRAIIFMRGFLFILLWIYFKIKNSQLQSNLTCHDYIPWVVGKTKSTTVELKALDRRGKLRVSHETFQRELQRLGVTLTEHLRGKKKMVNKQKPKGSLYITHF